MKKFDRVALAATLTLSVCVFSPAIAAESGNGVSVPADPRFTIKRLVVEGASLIPQEDIDALVSPYAGPARTFADLQAAVHAVETLYARRGYRTVKVILPEQQTGTGEFRIRVIEAKLGTIVVNGNQHFSDAQILATLPGLQEGESPDMVRVTHQLQLANENPARQAAVVLKEGKGDALVDAVVQVADQDLHRGIVYVDNTGSMRTGHERVGMAYQNANVLGLDHVLTLQGATSPDHLKEVSILGLGYKIPLYALGDAVEFNASYSNVNSGNVAGVGGGPSLSVSGSGATFSLAYHHLLEPLGDWRQRVTLTLEQKEFINKVLSKGTSLVPNLASRPISATYSGSIRSAEGERSLRVSAAANLPGNENNSFSAYNQTGARAGAKAQFFVLRWNAGWVERFAGDWTLNANANGQWTEDALISGEQFGIGGAQSVRGYEERALANDQGMRASLELQAPDQAALLGLANSSLHPVLFWDFGRVWRNHALPAETTHTTIASVGAGLRLQISNQFSVIADYGVITVPSPGHRSGDGRFHANLLYAF